MSALLSVVTSDHGQDHVPDGYVILMIIQISSLPAVIHFDIIYFGKLKFPFLDPNSGTWLHDAFFV